MDEQELKAAVAEALECSRALERKLGAVDAGLQDEAAMVRHALWRAMDQLGMIYIPTAPF